MTRFCRINRNTFGGSQKTAHRCDEDGQFNLSQTSDRGDGLVFTDALKRLGFTRERLQYAL